jgi:hypothetical protein
VHREFSVYNDVWVVKLFVCCHITAYYLHFAISARHAVRLFWVPGHAAGVRGNEIVDELARGGSAQRFVGPEPVLGVSRENIRRKMKCWIENKHLALWCGPCSTQRQARELISGPDLAMGARLLSFNMT